MEWTTGMVEYWNGGMNFFKSSISFPHPKPGFPGRGFRFEVHNVFGVLPLNYV